MARFLLLFPDATRLPYEPTPKEDAHTLTREPYELKTIAEHLPSLPWTHKDTKLASFVDEGIREFNKGKKDDERMVSEDALFEATRWHLYRRAYAEGTTDNITEDYVQILLETENQLLAKPKCRGDIKSKAKRMAEYMQNEFVIYDNIEGYAEWSKEKRNDYMRPYMKKYRKKKGLVMATRTEHMKKVNINKKIKTQAKIKAVLEDMFLREDVYTKAGKPKATAIAKILDISRNTVSAHLKEMGLL